MPDPVSQGQSHHRDEVHAKGATTGDGGRVLEVDLASQRAKWVGIGTFQQH